LIGAVDGLHEREAQNVFAFDQLLFTREREPGQNNEWCPELHDVRARDYDHVMSSRAFHGSTGKCGLNKLYRTYTFN
jgi:hypothetical protein